MRSLPPVLVAALLPLLVADGGRAALFDSGNSHLILRLGALPPIAISGNFGGAIAQPGPVATFFATPTKAFGPADVDVPDSLFTGVPQITDLRLSGLAMPGGALARTFSPGGGPGGGFGGLAPLSGTLTVCVFSCSFGIQVQVPLTGVGVGGIHQSTQTGVPLTVENLLAGWTTGPAVISGINTELVSFAGNVCAPVTCPVTTLAVGTGIGVYVSTVTFTGNNQLTPNANGGHVTLVTPVRTTSLAGSLPLFVVQSLTFLHGDPIPEPALALLLGAGAAALVGAGRRRTRR